VLPGGSNLRDSLLFLGNAGLSYASTTADCGAEQTSVTQSYPEEQKLQQSLLNSTAPNSHHHALARRSHILQKRLPADHKRLQEPVQLLRIRGAIPRIPKRT